MLRKYSLLIVLVFSILTNLFLIVRNYTNTHNIYMVDLEKVIKQISDIEGKNLDAKTEVSKTITQNIIKKIKLKIDETAGKKLVVKKSAIVSLGSSNVNLLDITDSVVKEYSR